MRKCYIFRGNSLQILFMAKFFVGVGEVLQICPFPSRSPLMGKYIIWVRRVLFVRFVLLFKKKMLRYNHRSANSFSREERLIFSACFAHEFVTWHHPFCSAYILFSNFKKSIMSVKSLSSKVRSEIECFSKK